MKRALAILAAVTLLALILALLDGPAPHWCNGPTEYERGCVAFR